MEWGSEMRHDLQRFEYQFRLASGVEWDLSLHDVKYQSVDGMTTVTFRPHTRRQNGPFEMMGDYQSLKGNGTDLQALIRQWIGETWSEVDKESIRFHGVAQEDTH